MSFIRFYPSKNLKCYFLVITHIISIFLAVTFIEHKQTISLFIAILYLNNFVYIAGILPRIFSTLVSLITFLFILYSIHFSVTLKEISASSN